MGAQIDTSNITNAFVSGMKEDLNLYGNQYNWIVVSWTVGYIIGQWACSHFFDSTAIHKSRLTNFPCNHRTSSWLEFGLILGPSPDSSVWKRGDLPIAFSSLDSLPRNWLDDLYVQYRGCKVIRGNACSSIRRGTLWSRLLAGSLLHPRQLVQ